MHAAPQDMGGGAPVTVPGERTALEYMRDPFLSARGEALRER